MLDTDLLWALETAPVPPAELPVTRRALEAMSLAAGLRRTPELRVVPSPVVNAFSTGSTEGDAVVCVTRGLAEGMGQAEQSAVLAWLVARFAPPEVLSALRDAHLRPDPAGAAAPRTAALPNARWYVDADASALLLLRDARPLVAAIGRLADADTCLLGVPEELGERFFAWPGGPQHAAALVKERVACLRGLLPAAEAGREMVNDAGAVERAVVAQAEARADVMPDAPARRQRDNPLRHMVPLERRRELLAARFSRRRNILALVLVAYFTGWVAAGAALAGFVFDALVSAMPPLLAVAWQLEPAEAARQVAAFQAWYRPVMVRLWAEPIGIAVSAVIAAAIVTRMLVTAARRKPWEPFGYMRAPRMSSRQHPETAAALKEMARANGFGAPALHLIESPGVNALVFGSDPEHLAVGVTRGFVRELDPEAQRAVFAHLLARVRSNDTRWPSLLTSLMLPLGHWHVRLHRALGGNTAPEMRPSPFSNLRDFSHERPRHVNPLVLPAMLPLMVLAEVLLVVEGGMRESAAVTADCDGALLLRDARPMLDALRTVLTSDTTVGFQADLFASLLYCDPSPHAGRSSSAKASRRIACLREIVESESIAVRPRAEGATA